jgi:hypothetical protein
MSKDPAFLFYSSDFLTGVLDLTMEERGQLITLMCLQHQKGVISDKTIRLLLGSSISADVLKKFEKDKDGNYFNSRLAEEIEKRENFTESRARNGKMGGRPSKKATEDTLQKTYQKPNAKPLAKAENNLPENEDEIEIVNDNDYKDFVATYSEWHKTAIGIPIKMNGGDGIAMKEIISYLKKATNENNTKPINAWKFILDNYSRWDTFHQKQTKLTQINYNLTNILNSIKNGNSNNKVNSDTLADIARRTSEELANND